MYKGDDTGDNLLQCMIDMETCQNCYQLLLHCHNGGSAIRFVSNGVVKSLHSTTGMNIVTI